VEEGDRMLLPCSGGRARVRLVRCPPPLEFEAAEERYVLVDDGPPERWYYELVPG